MGDFGDHVVGKDVEAGAAGIFHGDPEGFEDEIGALEVDGVAGEGVDDFHDGSLDGLIAFEQGYGMEARVGRGGDAAKHALVEVAEMLSAKGGGSAWDSVDLDMSADSNAGMARHQIYTSKK